MLTNLELRDFKSFERQRVDLAPLTILVGANATGKSNFLDAIRFLQGLSLDMPIGDVLQGHRAGGREVWLGIRGGPQETVRKGASSFRISSRWLVGAPEVALEHEIECATEPSAAVIGERLRVGGDRRYLFEATVPAQQRPGRSQRPGRLSVEFRVTNSRQTRRVSLSSSLGVVHQLRSVDRIDPHIVLRTRDLINALQSALFLEVDPRLMGNYVPKQMNQMGVHGQNLSAVLWELCNDHTRKSDFVDWLNEICAPELEDIDFDETKSGDLMFRLVERNGAVVSARSVSHGTLRFLGELVALQTASPGQIILIEEIENGLHPARIRRLVELLESVTSRQQVQVIATTHSPQVLRALSAETLANTVLFARMPGEPTTLLRRVGDLPDYRTLVQKRDVVDVLTTQWLERDL